MLTLQCDHVPVCCAQYGSQRAILQLMYYAQNKAQAHICKTVAMVVICRW